MATINAAALIKTIRRGYFDPCQNQTIVTQTVHETYFRVWTMSRGYWMECSVDGVQKLNALEETSETAWSLTIPSGSTVEITVSRDDHSAYRKTITFTIGEEQVVAEQPKGITLALKQETRSIQNINSKFRSE